MTEQTPQQWLLGHVNLEAGLNTPRSARERGAPTLDRIGGLLAYFGSPELEYPAVQITGTNGKTTTAHALSTLLTYSGLRVGTITSPHLERVNERMEVDGEPVDDATLDDLLRSAELVERAVGIEASYFEILVAIALRWFADEAVDVAVVEVGMGGTWDATNLVDGQVGVVTNVAVDHVEYLGTTREQIATEKAGIVKPGSTLVLGETDPALRPIFAAREAEQVLVRDAQFGVKRNVLAIGGRLVDFYTAQAEYPDVFLPLHGAHQADNAAAALQAAEAFVQAPLPHDMVEAAFRAVRSPGRLEVVGRNPLLLLDGAHNVAGAHALRTALDEEFGDGSVRTLIVGFLREKEPHEMLSALGLDDLAKEETGGVLVCCRPPSPRAQLPQFVAQAAIEMGFPEERIEIVDSVPEAVSTALLATPDDGQIVITGSLYVVGAARSFLVK
ncbi:MAG TPA: Mur ligase family protein [Acidimicrobiia bacterium]|nr:Mur ligase family protein [Acidimicrobiia bacterium]